MPENWREGRSRSRRARGRAVAVRMPLARRTDLGDSNYAGLEVDVCHDLQRCLRDTLDAGFDSPRHPACASPPPPPRAERARSLLSAARAVRALRPAPQLIAVEFAGGGQDLPVDRPRRRLPPPAPRQRGCAPSGTRVGGAPPSTPSLLPPPALKAANYARLVNQFLGALSHTALWVRVPVVAPEVESAEAATRTAAPNPRRRRLRAERGDVIGVGGRHARGCRRSHPPTRPRPVRALGESPSACARATRNSARAWRLARRIPPAAELDRWVGEPVRAVVVSRARSCPTSGDFPCFPSATKSF